MIGRQAVLLRQHDLVPPGPPADIDTSERPWNWYPTTRAPERLWPIYKGRTEGIQDPVIEGALIDLANLDLLPDLSEDGFNSAISERLAARPEVAEVFKHGRMRSADLEALIESRGSSEGAAEHALVLTRWLLHFRDDVHTVPSGEYEIVRGEHFV